MAKLKATSVAGDLTVTGKVTSTVAGATTSTIGTVKLNNATNSTSTTEAATAAAVKAAYDLANGKANASHGNHVPATQTANDAVYLRNDNTWQTITPDKIGALSAIQSPRDYTAGALIKTRIQGGNSIPFFLKIEGNSYGGGVPFLILVQGYQYNNDIASYSAISVSGNTNYSSIKAFNKDGELWFWLPYTSYWQGITASAFHSAATGVAKNMVYSIVNSGVPSGITRVKDIPIATSYTTTNKPSAADIGAAATSHGNHVPTTQTANNAVFLRNDNTWQTVTPANIGAVPTGDVATTATANKIVRLDGAADVNCRLLRSNYANQTTINGAIAYRTNNGSDNFLRFCSDTTAIRNWIGAAASNHGHSNATTSAHGFMSNTDKSKLDGIASGANAYTHPTGAGNNHIPSGGASGQFLKWSSSGVATWAADNNTWRGVQNNLTSTATDQSLSAAQGKWLNENKANSIGTLTHRAYSSNLDTQTGIGIYGFRDTCPGKPSEYGTVLQWANTSDARPGVDQHWVTQLGSSSFGRLYYRHRSNKATSYPSWNPLIQENDFGTVVQPDKIQKSFCLPNGLKVFTGWYDVGANATRTINYPSGTFNIGTAMPNISLCAPHGDWQNYQTAGSCVVISFDLYTFALANYGGKTARIVAWVIGQ